MLGSMPTSDDYRGWFYRVVAPNSAIVVVQSTAVVADRWFTHATSGDADFLLQSPPAVPSLDMVILHGGLGGCTSVGAALRAANRLLRQGGIVALAGHNRSTWPCEMPRQQSRSTRDALGLLRAARNAGFSNVSVYAAQPDFDAPNAVVSTDRASARAFYRFELEARAASGRVRFRRFRSAFIASNLAPHFQACFIVVAQKC
jgi:SAM-dependent methyltransferase